MTTKQNIVTVGMIGALVLGVIGVLVLGGLIGFPVNEAYGEPLIIEGNNGDKNIHIAIDGDNSIVRYQSSLGSFEAWDSNIKLFKHGFLLKNLEAGTVIFAHESNDKWKLTVKTFQGWTKFIAHTPSIQPIERIEPKSSVGTDISNWDIPTEGRINYKYIAPEKVFDSTTLEIISNVPNSVEYKRNLNFDFSVVDTAVISKKDQRIENANVEIFMINPFGESIQHWRGTTNSLGSFGDSWFVTDNEIIGEYMLNVTAIFGDFTKKSTITSFFVTPIDYNSTSKCPIEYFKNATNNPVCQIDCRDLSLTITNYTKNICQPVCEDEEVLNPVKNICEVKP